MHTITTVSCIPRSCIWLIPCHCKHPRARHSMWFTWQQRIAYKRLCLDATDHSSLRANIVPTTDAHPTRLSTRGASMRNTPSSWPQCHTQCLHAMHPHEQRTLSIGARTCHLYALHEACACVSCSHFKGCDHTDQQLHAADQSPFWLRTSTLQCVECISWCRARTLLCRHVIAPCTCTWHMRTFAYGHILAVFLLLVEVRFSPQVLALATALNHF
jgi:hypothetical protein